MARFLPVLAVFLLNCATAYIFRSPNAHPDIISDPPLFSSDIFALSVSTILLNVILYPCSFRPLHWIAANIYEFMICAFIMENSVVDFWFPLEYLIYQFPPTLGYSIYCACEYVGLDGTFMEEVLYVPLFGVMSCYFCSIVFLFCALHATKTVDFRLLRFGPRCFISDIMRSLAYVKCRFIRSVQSRSRYRLRDVDYYE